MRYDAYLICNASTVVWHTTPVRERERERASCAVIQNMKQARGQWPYTERNKYLCHCYTSQALQQSNNLLIQSI
jgi:hypothetical protein